MRKGNGEEVEGVVRRMRGGADEREGVLERPRTNSRHFDRGGTVNMRAMAAPWMHPAVAPQAALTSQVVTNKSFTGGDYFVDLLSIQRAIPIAT